MRDADKAEQAIGIVIGQLPGDEIAAIADKGDLLVGPGDGEAGEAAKRVVLG